MTTTLYKRDAKNKIRKWSIEQVDENSISIEYGTLDGEIQIKELVQDI